MASRRKNLFSESMWTETQCFTGDRAISVGSFARFRDGFVGTELEIEQISGRTGRSETDPEWVRSNEGAGLAVVMRRSVHQAEIDLDRTSVLARELSFHKLEQETVDSHPRYLGSVYMGERTTAWVV